MIYLAFQTVLLAMALGFSLWQLCGRFAPQLRASQQQKLAVLLMSPQAPRVFNRLGLQLMPRVASQCGSGCSACGICSGV